MFRVLLLPALRAVLISKQSNSHILIGKRDSMSTREAR